MANDEKKTVELPSAEEAYSILNFFAKQAEEISLNVASKVLSSAGDYVKEKAVDVVVDVVVDKVKDVAIDCALEVGSAVASHVADTALDCAADAAVECAGAAISCVC